MSGHANFDRKDFWDNKILKWEQERYGGRNAPSSWLEKIANSASVSLRYRMKVAKSILRTHCAGKSIVEIGCGTGKLAAELIEAGAERYHGFDISSVAIDEAKEIAEQAGLNDLITYTASDIEALPELDADIVFSTGLLDWLNDTEIEILLKKSKHCDCLHSFSESRVSLSQFFHRTYVYIAYGHRTENYIPRYLSAAWLENIAEQACSKPVHFIRDRRLSFGAFVSTLPNSKTHNPDE